MKGKHLHVFLIVVASFFLWHCGEEKPTIEPPRTNLKAEIKTPRITYKVVNTYPHDTSSYTEGFLFYNGKWLESTGAPAHIPHTRSAIGLANLQTGAFEKKAEIDKKIYFGEGIVVLKDKLYQLTYQNQTGFIYDAKTFNKIGQFSYHNKEGWGMTTDGKYLIYTDGTCNITFMNPDSFAVHRTIPVLENGYGVYQLNELEYIKGFLYANVWLTNRIVKIDPETGEVKGELDLSALFDQARSKYPRLNELNGIGYDAGSDKILVTGKLWPAIYELAFEH